MRAIISVSDKTGVVEFAKELALLGYEIISTSGTMRALQSAGVSVTNISDVTGFPEILGGRVKTLHPMVHGGLLAKRDDPEHLAELKKNQVGFIDLVCVNLYPFVKTIEKEDVKIEEAIENIDIGGPSMLRSAAKNYQSVTVVCDPSDYKMVIDEIKAKGDTTLETRFKLSAKAYTHTADYDAAISTYMREAAGLSEILRLRFEQKQALRYGENPHQKAKFYRDAKDSSYSLANATQIQGKELSYNNIQDANAALNIVREFGTDIPFAVGLKHMNPCGAAIGNDLKEAWTKAYKGDPVSIFGGIVATNQVIGQEEAKLMKYTIPKEGEEKASLFLEVILAPKFTEEAKTEFAERKNVRLIEYTMEDSSKASQYVSVNGGLLVQDQDSATKEIVPELTVTKVKPTKEQLSDLSFAWKIVKHVKSNAIVVVKDGATLGVGAGQMNRIGSAKIAIENAHQNGYKEGLVLGSDGFFPFGDTVLYAAENGVVAIVQPGGSIRDKESIDIADEKKVSMLFTGMRHFKH
ncbi:MAG: bifunctional phosphoribosylaminoimidazolecarboxamide formyltransferase/IMP cyclohydrolase [Firmicutes bacterium]|nr:bifunctional phosphoribosylaminoimidazolecarboxamide formyltransferase/IMP cyclohydrolase [Bacillota bacterium]MDD4263388.1 bifunctional phosphoribosylaminoimidazolecarboxamide formyltransferase/IMP cyclohydrolase [Bacillota bacterium]MDD4694108.1 bifunctional phosphoribosylaminoimidazolecarboxamide formyltransferase/IMP cyclohydrolase [Bacillota bacterium]